MEEAKKEVMKVLRSYLATVPGGIPMAQVNKDYRAFEDEDIDYKRFGFATLEDFVAQVPGLRRFQKCGVDYVEGVRNTKTGHVTDMVSKQKRPKRPKRKLPTMDMTSRRPMISGMNQVRPRYNNYEPQSPRRSFQAPNLGAYQNARNYPPRNPGNAEFPRSYGARNNGSPEPPVKTYPPRSNGNAEAVKTYPPRAAVHAERQVTTYPSRPVLKSEPTVTIYPPRPVIKSEPGVTVYPPRAVVKSEPPVTIYPAFPPMGEQIPETRGNQSQGKSSQNDNFSRVRSPPIHSYQSYNNNGLKLSPPQTPQSFNFPDDFRGNVFRSDGSGINQPNLEIDPAAAPNGYRSMPPLVSLGQNDNQRIPPLKLMRPLSERLRRPSPEPPIIEMASGMKSAESSFGFSTPLTPTLENGDPRDQLSALVKRLNLSEPEYKTLNVGKGGRIRIFSQVMVGKQKFSSYPFDAVDEVEAAKLAAGSAVSQLQKLDRSPVEMRITEDRALVMQRILGIVDGHPNGVFRDRLPGFYKDLHEELLPEDWVTLIEQCQELSLEKGVENSVIVCRNLSKKSQRPKSPPLSPKRDRPLIKPPAHTPLPLLLPPSPLWPVYVSHVSSTSDVWIRLLEDEYNEKFYTMSQQLNVHYSSCTEPTTSVAILNYYVTKIDDEAHRVRVEGLDPLTGDVEIFFVDTGDNDVVDPTKLFPLDKQFLGVPPQAMRACLSSLEEIPECDTTTEIAEKHLLDKTFYMQVLSRDQDELSPVVVGIFYDTNSEADVNVNEIISEELHRVMELTRPEAQVAVKGKLLEVFVSHVEVNGDVYLQVKNDGITILMSMLNSLLEGVVENEGLLNKALVKGPLDPEEIYLAQKPDGAWARVQVSSSDQDISARSIDFGDTVEIDLGKILRLRELSETLARFPAQAIKVEMNNLGRARFTERMSCRLRELAAPGDGLLCKIVQAPVFGRAAVVELFKRTQPENLLISINNTLDLESELIKCGDGNNNLRRKRLERRGSKSSDDSLKRLMSPEIPAVGEFFNVRVTNLVSSPGNFIVQPFEEKPKLESMMESLQEAYKTADAPKIPMNELEKGKVFAVKNYDGYWYRACINRVLDEQLVSVHLCDFGSICMVTLSQVQPLKREFFDLPYQAIKARLVGIQPINGDWSLPACLQFQKLVVNKNFASVIRRLENDDSTPPNVTLGLELIDVTLADRDIYIHNILIDERKALPEAV